MISENRLMEIEYVYGVSRKKLWEMYRNQDGKCAICRTSVPFCEKPSNIDHDHKTGKVRGILCESCNVLVAKIESSKQHLSSRNEALLGDVIRGYIMKNRSNQMTLTFFFHIYPIPWFERMKELNNWFLSIPRNPEEELELMKRIR